MLWRISNDVDPTAFLDTSTIDYNRYAHSGQKSSFLYGSVKGSPMQFDEWKNRTGEDKASSFGSTYIASN